MRSTTGTLALTATLALLIPQGAFADGKTAQTPAAEPCMTSTGIPGVLIEGLHHAVQLPEQGLRLVQLNDAKLVTDNFAFNGAIVVLMDGGPPSEILVESVGGSAKRGRSYLTFEGDDMLAAYSCYVDNVPYDPAAHDLSRITRGQCGFGAEQKVAQMGLGETITLEMPERLTSLPVAAPVYLQDGTDLVDETKVSLDFERVENGAKLAITARQSGPAAFLWSVSDDQGNKHFGGICPVLVGGADLS